MTLEEAKAIVRERHPDETQYCRRIDGGLCQIVSERNFKPGSDTLFLSGFCKTEKAAWLSAARRVQESAPPPT